MRITLFLFVVMLAPGLAQVQDLELHFIDIRQGDSTLVVCPNGNRMLVDAGELRKGIPALTAGQLAAIKQQIVDNLADPITPQLDYLVVTHGDGDHYRLLSTVLDGVTVDTILYGGRLKDYAATTRTWLLDKPEGLLVSPTGSDPESKPNRFFDCGSADVWILAANTADTSRGRKNTGSIVVKVTHGTFDAILTGDATFKTETAIRDAYSTAFLNVDLLKLGHHGSRTTSTDTAWASETKPEISIASAARGKTSGNKQGNWFGHPAEEVLDRVEPCALTVASHDILKCDGKFNCQVEQTDRAIYATATSGTIIVKSDGTGWEVSTDGGATFAAGTPNSGC